MMNLTLTSDWGRGPDVIRRLGRLKTFFTKMFQGATQSVVSVNRMMAQGATQSVVSVNKMMAQGAIQTVVFVNKMMARLQEATQPVVCENKMMAKLQEATQPVVCVEKMMAQGSTQHVVSPNMPSGQATLDQIGHVLQMAKTLLLGPGTVVCEIVPSVTAGCHNAAIIVIPDRPSGPKAPSEVIQANVSGPALASVNAARPNLALSSNKKDNVNDVLAAETHTDKYATTQNTAVYVLEGCDTEYDQHVTQRRCMLQQASEEGRRVEQDLAEGIRCNGETEILIDINDKMFKAAMTSNNCSHKSDSVLTNTAVKTIATTAEKDLDIISNPVYATPTSAKAALCTTEATEAVEGRDATRAYEIFGKVPEVHDAPVESCATLLTCLGDGPARHGDGPAWHGNGPAWHGDGPAWHGDRPACHGDGPAWHGDGPACHGDGPARHGDGPACHGDGPACHGDGPARYGDGPARHGDGPACHGDGPRGGPRESQDGGGNQGSSDGGRSPGHGGDGAAGESGGGDGGGGGCGGGCGGGGRGGGRGGGSGGGGDRDRKKRKDAPDNETTSDEEEENEKEENNKEIITSVCSDPQLPPYGNSSRSKGQPITHLQEITKRQRITRSQGTQTVTAADTEERAELQQKAQPPQASTRPSVEHMGQLVRALMTHTNPRQLQRFQTRHTGDFVVEFSPFLARLLAEENVEFLGVFPGLQQSGRQLQEALSLHLVFVDLQGDACGADVLVLQLHGFPALRLRMPLLLLLVSGLGQRGHCRLSQGEGNVLQRRGVASRHLLAEVPVHLPLRGGDALCSPVSRQHATQGQLLAVRPQPRDMEHITDIQATLILGSGMSILPPAARQGLLQWLQLVPGAVLFLPTCACLGLPASGGARGLRSQAMGEVAVNLPVTLQALSARPPPASPNSDVSLLQRGPCQTQDSVMVTETAMTQRGVLQYTVWSLHATSDLTSHTISMIPQSGLSVDAVGQNAGVHGQPLHCGQEGKKMKRKKRKKTEKSTEKTSVQASEPGPVGDFASFPATSGVQQQQGGHGDDHEDWTRRGKSPASTKPRTRKLPVQQARPAMPTSGSVGSVATSAGKQGQTLQPSGAAHEQGARRYNIKGPCPQSAHEQGARRYNSKGPCPQSAHEQGARRYNSKGPCPQSAHEQGARRYNSKGPCPQSANDWEAAKDSSNMSAPGTLAARPPEPVEGLDQKLPWEQSTAGPVAVNEESKETLPPEQPPSRQSDPVGDSCRKLPSGQLHLGRQSAAAEGTSKTRFPDQPSEAAVSAEHPVTGRSPRRPPTKPPDPAALGWAPEPLAATCVDHDLGQEQPAGLSPGGRKSGVAQQDGPVSESATGTPSRDGLNETTHHGDPVETSPRDEHTHDGATFGTTPRDGQNEPSHDGVTFGTTPRDGQNEPSHDGATFGTTPRDGQNEPSHDGATFGTTPRDGQNEPSHDGATFGTTPRDGQNEPSHDGATFGTTPRDGQNEPSHDGATFGTTPRDGQNEPSHDGATFGTTPRDGQNEASHDGARFGTTPRDGQNEAASAGIAASTCPAEWGVESRQREAVSDTRSGSGDNGQPAKEPTPTDPPLTPTRVCDPAPVLPTGGPVTAARDTPCWEDCQQAGWPPQAGADNLNDSNVNHCHHHHQHSASTTAAAAAAHGAEEGDDGDGDSARRGGNSPCPCGGTDTQTRGVNELNYPEQCQEDLEGRQGREDNSPEQPHGPTTRPFRPPFAIRRRFALFGVCEDDQHRVCDGLEETALTLQAENSRLRRRVTCRKCRQHRSTHVAIPCGHLFCQHCLRVMPCRCFCGSVVRNFHPFYFH